MITWPDGNTMSALGLAEAFKTALPRDVAGKEMLVASESAFVLLKLIAYQENAERRKDVLDVVRQLETYAEDNERRFDLFDTVVDGTVLDFRHMGAYLMGRDVRALARPRSLAVVRAFAARIDAEEATPVIDVIREEGRRYNDERVPHVYRLLRAFIGGLGETP